MGFCAIGRKVAAILQAFGAKVLVYDPYVLQEDIIKWGCNPASIDEIFICL
jgi:phosphoglycerate dehydrogenase-like enzyme